MTTNIVSLSGGKDSTALALLAFESKVDNIKLVFADTGHEHFQTYDYLRYLDETFTKQYGVGIDFVQSDFSAQIARKREIVKTKWAEEGIPQEQIDRALDALKPTGNPFLDLCLWKGRFPSTMARFCSQELKRNPLEKYQQKVWENGESCVISWQGVRRDESPSRRNLPEKDVEIGSWEPEPRGILIYRPILDWTAADCFDMHRKHGIKHNPLYEQGMGRVGCMPCIHANKRELREIAARFPDEIARVAEWEDLVSNAARRGAATFRSANGVANGDVNLESHGIWAAVEWSKTVRGGKQYDIITTDAETCSSQYGLCE